MEECIKNYVNNTFKVDNMNLLINIFISIVSILILIFYELPKGIIKIIIDIYNYIFDKRTIALNEKNLTLTFKYKKDNIIDINTIIKVLYFYKGSKTYFYIVKDNSDSIELTYPSYLEHSYSINDEKLFIDILTKTNILLIPLLRIHSPMSWVCGITVGGFNDTKDIITIAGDEKQLCVYFGLDCNEGTNSFIFNIDNINFKNIFNIELKSFNKNRIVSTYEVYIINKNITLNRGYGFIPWSKREFIESEIYYSFNLLEIKQKVEIFFKKYNNKNKVMINKKVCHDWNNNP